MGGMHPYRVAPAWVRLVGALASIAMVLSLSTSARADDQLDLPALAERARRSVVLLTVKDDAGRKVGTGTGFIVSPDGRVVTNNHVIEDAEHLEATLFDDKSVPVLGVYVADAKRDIAVLKIAGEGYLPLTLGASTTARVGEDVVVIGNPRGLSGSLSTGVIAALRERGLADIAEDQKYESWAVQITAPIAPGSSGSPVLNRRGEVLAVAVGVRADTQGLNFAVPIEVAKTLLEGLGPTPKVMPLAASPSPTSSTWQNLAISAGVFALIALVVFLAGRTSRARKSTRPGRPGTARPVN